MWDLDPPEKRQEEGKPKPKIPESFIHSQSPLFSGGGEQVAGTLKATHFPLLSLNLRAVLKGKT